MDYNEAVEWLTGNRSSINTTPEEPRKTWQMRTAQTDAAYTQQAYWIVKAHSENILAESKPEERNAG